MRLFIITASFWVLVLAKPEMYREKEDFQFSRSSSDEGSKSGYYGAQRGNMGGNYEKAHNMDSLAQHQMSSVVGQVDGELGEGARTRTGSVYTAGNSRGIFGSGNYDYSNLKGRNFAEGTSFDDSSALSQSSRNLDYGSLYSSANDARRLSHQYQSSALDSQHQTSGSSSQYAQIEDQQVADRHRDSHNYEYGSQSGKVYKYSSHSGSQARSDYDQSNANLYNGNAYDYSTGGRLVQAVPVRIYGRPGTRVAIPVSAPTYDASQSSSSHDQSAISSDAELLSTNRNRFNYLPTNKAKHYESAYSYRKEWEKHGTQPMSPTSTENPFSTNSELYEDAQSSLSNSNLYQSKTDSMDSQSNSAYLRGYSDNTQSASSSRSQYAAEEQSSGSSAISNSYAHSRGTSASSLGSSDGTANLNTLEDISSRPKSYQHSYSYHKSWERRGDPYVIRPALDVNKQASQKLTSANSNTYLCSYCVEDGQQRVRRSYNPDQYEQDQNTFNTQTELGPESMNTWGKNLGQQEGNKWDQLQDLGQQTQNQWGALEDLGQQAQSQWDKLEDLGQQTQNGWDKLEDLGQQTHNQVGKLENLGQQTQNQWDQLEDLGQHPGNQLGKLEDLGQQPQNQLDKLEDLGQESQNQWDKLEDLGQQTHKQWGNLENLGQEIQNQWINSEYLGHPQYNQQERNIEQQSWPGIMGDLGQQDQNTENFEKFYQSHHNTHNFNSQNNNWNQQTNSENIFYDNKNYYDLWNSYSNIAHIPINSEVPQEKNSVDRQQSLWDKIENAFKEDEINNSFEYSKLNTQDSQVNNVIDKNFKDSSANDEWDFLFNPTSGHSNTQKFDTTLSSSSQNIQSNNDLDTSSKVEDTLPNLSDMDKPYNKESENISHSIDNGRGDIGPEDILLESSNKMKDKEDKEMNKQNQSEAIEEPLLLSVVGIDQQGEQEKKAIIESITTSPKTPNNLSSTERSFFSNENTSFIVKYDKERGSEQSLQNNEFIQSLNIEQTDNDDETLKQNFLKPHEQTRDQQIIQPSNKQTHWHQIETLDDQNMGQQQMNEHENLTPEGLEQQNMDQIQMSNTQNLAQELETFDQQNMGQQLENFEQQNMGQQLEPFEQQNMGQHLENFEQQNMGQQLENFEQQNMRPQLENFEQQNMGQQLEPFEQQNMGQHLENFEQQNMGQQLENFEQQNMGQQLENFEQQNMGQQLEPFDQQNVGQKLENFEQQNMGQQLETFEQQSMGQDLENFEHQNMGQQLENFEQQNMGQQSIDTENINQLKSIENQNTDEKQMFEAQNIRKLDTFSPEIVDHKPFEQQNQNTMLVVGRQNEDAVDAQQSTQRAKQPLSENDNEVPVPIEPTTDKPGFWSYLRNKTKNAKDTVVSWFHK